MSDYDFVIGQNLQLLHESYSTVSNKSWGMIQAKCKQIHIVRHKDLSYTNRKGNHQTRSVKS